MAPGDSSINHLASNTRLRFNPNINMHEDIKHKGAGECMIYAMAFLFVIAGVGLDQFTKYLAATHLKENAVTLIDGVFQLRYLENRGAAFGMFQDRQVLFIIVSLIALILLGFFYVRIPKIKRFSILRICILLIECGGIGNLIDRVRLNYVVDFFYIECINFPIFNVADIFATIATAGLLLLFIFYYSQQEMEFLWSLFLPKKKKDKTDQADKINNTGKKEDS